VEETTADRYGAYAFSQSMDRLYQKYCAAQGKRQTIAPFFHAAMHPSHKKEIYALFSMTYKINF
jgi:hypothetical protein